jgi:hypothetical protein
LPGPIVPSHQPNRVLAGIAFVGAETVTRAGFDGRWCKTCRMSIPAQRMADENDVVARGRQRAVRLVGDADGKKLPSAVELKRFGKLEKLRVDDAD